MLHIFLSIYQWVSAHEAAILALTGGGTTIAIFAQGVLHKLNRKWQINSKPFSYTLVQVLTVISALAAYIVSNSDVGVVYPWLAVIAATVHRYAVSPYYTKKILPYLNFLSESADPELDTVTPNLQPETVTAPAPAVGFLS